MQLNSQYLGLSLLMVVVMACSGGHQNMNEKSLLEYGVPITILAPDSLNVQRSSIGFQEDITVKGDDGFNIQIFVSDAVVPTLEKAIEAHVESVEGNPLFHQIVEKKDDGFIFENRIDSTQTFGFRHIRLMGGKEYIFQEPLLGTLSEEKARELYDAVSYQAKK